MKDLPQIYCQKPEDIPQQFVDAWNQRDAAAIAGLFVEDAEFVNVVGLWWHDRQAIWKAHDYGLRVIFKDSKLELRQTKVRSLSNTHALVHARMRLTGQTGHEDVEKPRARFNVFSMVAEKRDKGWVCVSAHNTDQVPGKETNIVDEQGAIRSVDYRNR
jgi:uncharacterized protein (TIGR02246 family)